MAPKYYRVNDAKGVRILIGDDGGVLSRYARDGDWIDDGYLARWMGPGGDFYDDVVAPGDLPALTAYLDRTFRDALRRG